MSSFVWDVSLIRVRDFNRGHNQSGRVSLLESIDRHCLFLVSSLHMLCDVWHRRCQTTHFTASKYLVTRVLESGLFMKMYCLECAEGAYLPPGVIKFLFGFGLISGLTLIRVGGGNCPQLPPPVDMWSGGPAATSETGVLQLWNSLPVYCI